MQPKHDPFLVRLLWLTLAGVLLILLWHYLPMWDRRLAGPPAEPRAVTARGDLAADEKATIELFEKSKGSVVFITTRQQVRDFWTRNVFSVPRGTGSGFIWDEDGHVVTNFHVVKGASEASVKLADGRDYKAVLVGASAAHDIAVLRIGLGRKGAVPVPIGTSHNLRVGQKVFAIGNPFGLDWTLTDGIVSALDRSLDGENGSIEHLIQTDAAINPGNSGGPLLDSAGRLIGMNTAIYSPSGASAGIGFAVPVDTVNRVVPQIIRSGKYTRPVLNLGLDEAANAKLGQVLGIKGVFILQVPAGSEEARAGLRGAAIRADGSVVPGDVILAVGGKEVDSVGKLLALLDDYQIGDTVTLTLLRDNTTVDVQVRLQPGV